MAKTIHTDKAPKAIGPYIKENRWEPVCLLAVKFLYLLKLEKSQEKRSEQTEQVLKNIGAI